MERKLIALFSIRRKLWHHLSSPFASLVLALSLAVSSIPHLEASAAELLPTHKQIHVTSDANAKGTPRDSVSTFPSNGTYLYGQSPEANQVGHSYAVIEVNGDNAVGAFYMPSSSFDCFYGEVGSNHLDLTVVNSYEQAAYNYLLPMTDNEPIASADGVAVSTPQLVGYHQISTLSDADHQILATCRANHSNNI
ncbi:MAG: hypothetical protein AAGA75_14460 [Cyanobacteria bacterium P01_E01_bin.6]